MRPSDDTPPSESSAWRSPGPAPRCRSPASSGQPSSFTAEPQVKGQLNITTYERMNNDYSILIKESGR